MTRRITAIIAHDAGGAELLSSWVRRGGAGDEIVLALAGPALKVFERKLGPVELLPFEQAVVMADRVITGTGWQSTLELDAIRFAHSLGKPSAAFIDHWVNYRERFQRGHSLTLPDSVWVGDALALALARQVLPERPLRLVENPYFTDIREELACHAARPQPTHGALNLLYVCEPIAEHALKQFGNPRHWGYTEHDALGFCLRNLGRLQRPVGRIVVRRHPAEAADKYWDVLREFGLPVEFGGANSLVAEVAACDVVAGCASMAMVVGLLAGKRVISTIPPGGGPCRLPHAEIEMLRDRVPS